MNRLPVNNQKRWRMPAPKIGNRVAEEGGFSYENVIVPYARAIAMIETGEADLLISLSNPRLKESAVQVAHVNKQEIVVVGRQGSDYASMDSLRGKVVAAVRGAEYDKRLSADRLKKIYFSTGWKRAARPLRAYLMRKAGAHPNAARPLTPAWCRCSWSGRADKPSTASSTDCWMITCISNSKIHPSRCDMRKSYL